MCVFIDVISFCLMCKIKFDESVLKLQYMELDFK